MLDPFAAALLAVAPVLKVALLLLVACLVFLLITGRLGRVGEILLFALLIAAAFTLPWLLAFRNLGRPDQLVAGVVFFIGLILLVRVVLKLFPFPMPWFLALALDTPARELVLPRALVLDRMALGPGMRVVEVGPGPGFLSFEVARRILPGGRLACVDIQPQLVERIRLKAEKAGVSHVEAITGRAEKLPLDDDDNDLVFYAGVLGEVPRRQDAVNEAFRTLRPGGVLSVTEAIPDPHYCSRSEVRKLAHRAGFEEASAEGNFYSYTITFRKPGQYVWRGY